MKKIFLIIIVGILLISGVNAIGYPEKENTTEIYLKKSLTFSTPKIIHTAEYAKIQLSETEFLLRDSGKPLLPMITYSFDLPFKAKNIDIKFLPSVEFEIELTQKIIPTSQVVTNSLTTDIESTDLIEDISVYSSSNRYPTNWYDKKITCGLNSNEERVTHIILYVYPVQYSPALNKLYYIKGANLEIIYDTPDKPMNYQEEYDLVIIAPKTFSKILNKLVVHKNNIGTKTFLKTTEEIYDQYTGVDKPEQIKYFIKDAIETNNITYVLLVGGLKSLFYAVDREHINYGSKYWHVPVRYTNIVKTGDLQDFGALCDLYYADVYKEGGEFDDWDSNDDGIIAKWTSAISRDVLDFNPDVYVGRLPCRNKNQLKIVVNKIIQYETSTPTSDTWYTRMIGISGRSFELYNGQPDGEYLTDLAMSYVDDIIDEEIRVYASNVGTGNPIPELKDTAKAFSKGARFVYFSGHGSPLVWVTHPANTTDVWMKLIYAKDLWRFSNFKKLPVVVVGGCHDAQYNITLYTSLKSMDLGNDRYYWTHGMPGVACFCWRLMIIPWGGAVSVIGGTGLTTSYTGDPNTLNAKLATDFFYEIGQNGAKTFGAAFDGSIQKFLDENTIGQGEAHAITIWNALGDPSLQIN